ncbi:MAG: hypothetical protein ACLQSX_12075 [Smithella sp.]
MEETEKRRGEEVEERNEDKVGEKIGEKITANQRKNIENIKSKKDS